MFVSSQLSETVPQYKPVFLDGWQPMAIDMHGQPTEDPIESQHKHEALRQTQQVYNLSFTDVDTATIQTTFKSFLSSSTGHWSGTSSWGGTWRVSIDQSAVCVCLCDATLFHFVCVCVCVFGLGRKTPCLLVKKGCTVAVMTLWHETVVNSQYYTEKLWRYLALSFTQARLPFSFWFIFCTYFNSHVQIWG